MKIAQYLHAVGTLLIGIALVVAVVMATNAWQTGGNARTLNVTGKATAKLASDESTITGSFRAEAKSTEEARDQAEEQASKGIEAIKALGIEDKDLKTLSADVYPEYDYTVSRGSEIKGYVATTTVQVTLTDTEKAQSVINSLTESGASSTTGPQFGLSTAAREDLQKELEVAAVADARKQAEALAEQAGGRVGKVLTISPGSLSYGGETPLPYLRSDAVATADMVAESSSDLQPGENELVVTVTVTYQLK